MYRPLFGYQRIISGPDQRQGTCISNFHYRSPIRRKAASQNIFNAETIQPCRRLSSLLPNHLPINFPYSEWVTIRAGTIRTLPHSMTALIAGLSIGLAGIVANSLVRSYLGNQDAVCWAMFAATFMSLGLGFLFGGLNLGGPRLFGTSHCMVIAALGMRAVPVMDRTIMDYTESWDPRTAAMVSTLLLFGIPMVSLAALLPITIENRGTNINHAAKSSGEVLALALVGSAIGVVGIGLSGLPEIGSHNILRGWSWFLFLVALISVNYRIIEQRNNSVSLTLMIALALLFISTDNFARNHAFRLVEPFELVEQNETPQGRIRVVDDKKRNIRWLFKDLSVLCAMDLKTGQNLLAYQSAVKKLRYFHPHAKNLLILGLSGGHLAHDFRQHGIRVDTIESNPAVVEFATRYFNLKDSGSVILANPRFHINQSTKRYDLIVHETVDPFSESAHLISLEMLSALHGRLSKGGILAINFMGLAEQPDIAAVQTLYRTLGQRFKYRLVFVSSPRKRLNDFIILAADKPLPIDSPRAGRRLLQWFGAHNYPFVYEPGPLITDDYNPLVNLQQKKFERYRESLYRRFGTEPFAW